MKIGKTEVGILIVSCQNNSTVLDKYIRLMHTNTYTIYSQKGEFMRTTLNIEDSLIDKAAKLTGVKEKTSLVRLGLEALIARESSKRLAKLGGTEKQLDMIPRRRLAGAE
jgi:Arc/MetJ family transcription regulator